MPITVKKRRKVNTAIIEHNSIKTQTQAKITAREPPIIIGITFSLIPDQRYSGSNLKIGKSQ